MQADPIRAPARAEDLTLRHRVRNYRAGDLERKYRTLDVEEGFFINYGFLPRRDYLRMHPRVSSEVTSRLRRRAAAIAAFVRARGTVHQREIVARFDHGKTTNYWGRQSNATTHLLGIMHYHSFLRVAHREDGVRVYEIHQSGGGVVDNDERRSRVDALVDVVVRAYAPLPAPSLAMVIARLRYATPQWNAELKPALARAKQRLGRARIDGTDWYWPPDERPELSIDREDDVRALSPFDPIVWDRRRFALLFGWEYRFEAYTPADRRKLGYYALPLLWRDDVVGWGNAALRDDTLAIEVGYVKRTPRDAGYRRELAAEAERLRETVGAARVTLTAIR